MLGNTRQTLGVVSRLIHWGMAIMIPFQLLLGFRMVSAYDAWKAGRGGEELLMALSRAHDTLGLTVLILVLVRLGWRVSQPTPDLPQSFQAYQRVLARLTHAALYALLIAFPLTGWATLSAYTDQFPIFFFGWDHVPRIVPQAAAGSPFNSDFFSEIHEACWKIGGALLALHVVAALWHEVVRKDRLLSRMLDGTPAAGD
jgi:cytochrome b561